MTQKILAAVGAAAFVVALAGCGGGDSETSQSSTTTSKKSTTTEETTAETTAASGAVSTTVTIDGKPKDFTGDPTCVTTGGNINIGIGEGTSAIAAVISDADPPKVESVGLGNVDGVVLAVGLGAGNAEATKDGKTYTITGTATGVDTGNPLGGIIEKPFEIKVTCP